MVIVLGQIVVESQVVISKMFEKIESILKYNSWTNKSNKELGREVLDEMIKISGMPLGTNDRLCFSKYNLKYGDKKAYIATMAMADIDKDGKWFFSSKDQEAIDNWCPPTILTLQGDCGLGKTHLAISSGWETLLRLKNEFKDDKVNEEDEGKYRQRKTPHSQDIIDMYSVIYRQTGALLNELRSGYKDDTFGKLLEDCKNCRLLILDDLGAEQKTEWAFSMLDEIIDSRYINRERTIITTNVKPSKLSERIASRLSDTEISEVVVMKGEDYRMIDKTINTNGGK